MFVSVIQRIITSIYKNLSRKNMVHRLGTFYLHAIKMLRNVLIFFFFIYCKDFGKKIDA